MTVRKILPGLAIAALLTGCSAGQIDLNETVSLLRLPEGGRLPHAVIDNAGTVHVVYFEGEPRSGDLRYVTRPIDAVTWSEPMYVNSQPGTVVGIGPIDGGQIALGKNDRVHVVWFKLNRTEFLYTRTTEDGTAFEPQFSLAAGAGVEAGPSVAAADAGNVYVFWHTGEPPESERSVFMTMSNDDGERFTAARPISRASEGACDCCALHARTDDAGAVYVSYRGAGNNIRRGQRLLTSHDRGASFSDELIDLWEINACPISTTGLTNGPTGMSVAWETEGQVYFTKTDSLRQAVSPGGTADARRRNPRVAINHVGESLFVWGDAISWQAGGSFHWQQFDSAGQPMSNSGTGAEIPDGSLPAVVAEPDGTFLVIY